MPLDDASWNDGGRQTPRNVLGGPLAACSTKPLTGFYRDGCCRTGMDDHGNHSVCAVMTVEFLAFSQSRGNDLSTPRPEYEFPGLSPGDRWCLCAPRWQEAFAASCAPSVVLEATDMGALAACELSDLRRHAASDRERDVEH